MSHARFLVGDVHERLTELDDNSVDLIMTSPPFLALRSYLPQDHPDKGKEIGSEPDPGVFIDVMCSLVDDLARVLAPHGSMVFEFGDTYAGSGGGGGDYQETGLRGGQNQFDGSASGARRASRKGYGGAADRLDSDQSKAGVGWPRAKSLALVPELFRITLAYGTNPLTGRVWWEGDQRWMVRNVVRWVRPNPPVGALGDKFRPATSELAVFTRDPRRYFDLDAVRTAYGEAYEAAGSPKEKEAGGTGANNAMAGRTYHAVGGAPPLDWWNITTSGYPGSHYAVYPSELCVIPVKSMCPERVCRTCGEPSRRLTGETKYLKPDGTHHTFHGDGFDDPSGSSANRRIVTGHDNGNMTAVRQTVGWSDCGHDQWRPGMVLDPFAGTGTTLAVATGHGRDATGIDIDQRNANLATDRIGPLFLTVEHPTPA